MNAACFLIAQRMANINTIQVVKVINSTNSGGLSAVGFVDVQIMVNQVDGAGNATPHGIIYNVPYTRIQGGTNAVILDPVIGDIGWCAFAQRDISSVKRTKKVSNPGSFRLFDYADGVYIGGILNGSPSQYIRFSGDGITLFSPTAVTITAPTVQIGATDSVVIDSPLIALAGQVTQVQGSGSSGDVSMTGPVNVSNDVVAGGKSLEGHVHSGVEVGSSDTGPPV